MPIYEYRCESCGHEFETIQKISEEPLKVCPECEKDALIKKISAVGFRLKGGGWYETDFKSDNKRNLSASDSASSGDSGSGSGSDSGSGSGSGSGSKDSKTADSKKPEAKKQDTGKSSSKSSGDSKSPKKGS